MATEGEIIPHLIHSATHFEQTPTLKNTYYYKSFSFPYSSGRVVLSSTPDGTGPVTFYNLMSVYGILGTRGDFSFGDSCTVMSIPPIDITNFLTKSSSSNTMAFSLSYRRGSCGPPTINKGGVLYQYTDIGDLYVVYFDDSAKKPVPFLIPPWDYKAMGLDLDQALTRVDSSFDHQYPLAHVLGVDEPPDATSSILRYDRTVPESVSVGSGNDSYSWGKQAGITNGTPVLAAAGGTVTYQYDHTNGHSLFINHGNGFQTRYIHLQKSGLVTENATTVTQGQVIGRVGVSGNVDRPTLHFMVVRDKNGDGNFEDNIPDGIVDPFGWQSFESDPWESYSFTYAGKERTGSRSYYLWEGGDRLLSRATLHKNGNRMYANNFTLDFPRYAVSHDVLVRMQLQQPLSFTSFRSIGSSLLAQVHDGFGLPITNFNTHWDLIITFNKADVARFNPKTLSIYSRADGEAIWQKENTTLDFVTGKAQTAINHMSEFGLFGQPLDSIAPVTTATLVGDLDTSGIYTSEIKISLQATDTPTEYTQGIDYILYKIGDTNWQEYSDTFTLSGAGTYEVSYYAVDNDGNAEAIDTLTLTIDYTPLTPPQHQPLPIRQLPQ